MRKKYRREGELSRLKSSKYPNNLLFFDTETTQIIAENGIQLQDLKLGVARYIQLDKNLSIKKDIESVFYSSDAFLSICLSHIRKGQKLYIFAHNVAFDIMVLNLPTLLQSKGIETQPPIMNGMVFLWDVKIENKKLTFINTGNYVPYSLEKIGNDIGVYKSKVNFANVSDNELLEYCKQDCEIIKEFILRFISFLHYNDLGEFKLTLASQAFTTYRYKFMSTQPHIHNNKQVIDLERSAYKGGRTEVFKLGDYNTHEYFYTDINSMYPYCMLGNDLPTKLVSFMPENNLNLMCAMMSQYYVVADVVVNTNEPVFGIKYSHKTYTINNSDIKPSHGKLIFPIGRFRVQLHHSELEYAIQHKMIDHVISYAIYERGELFTDYINFFNKIKVQASVEHNDTNRLISKLLNNSLYGKFGQKFKDTIFLCDDTFFPTGIEEIFIPEDNIHYTEFVWYGKRYRNIDDGESTYSMPMIAGAITAKARMLLWSHIQSVQIKNMLYTDTDSLIINQYGYEQLKNNIHENTLGMLKLEKQSNHVIIRGCKDYSFGEDHIRKGVPKNPDYMDSNMSVFTRFQGFKEWLNTGGDKQPIVWKQLKIRRNEYDKGVVLRNGDIRPFSIT